jgi:hypothetical protein
MQIFGLPEHLRNYSLAYFEYFATGEGCTISAELLNSKDQKPTIGFNGLDYEIIPSVLEKDWNEQKYLSFNPEFEATFLKLFGAAAWQAFSQVCVQRKNVLDLKIVLHYNLS